MPADPRLLITPPDLSIFHEDVELHHCWLHDDSVTGNKRVVLRGKVAYERLFSTLRFLRGTCLRESSQLTHRLVCNESSVRVRWAAQLCLR